MGEFVSLLLQAYLFLLTLYDLAITVHLDSIFIYKLLKLCVLLSVLAVNLANFRVLAPQLTL